MQSVGWRTVTFTTWAPSVMETTPVTVGGTSVAPTVGGTKVTVTLRGEGALTCSFRSPVLGVTCAVGSPPPATSIPAEGAAHVSVRADGIARSGGGGGSALPA